MAKPAANSGSTISLSEGIFPGEDQISAIDNVCAPMGLSYDSVDSGPKAKKPSLG